VKKDPKVFLAHILDSISLIEKYSKNMTQSKFQKNRALQDAIIRRLEIIGEAVKNLPSLFKTQYPDIPWKQMVLSEILRITPCTHCLVHIHIDE